MEWLRVAADGGVRRRQLRFAEGSAWLPEIGSVTSGRCAFDGFGSCALLSVSRPTGERSRYQHGWALFRWNEAGDHLSADQVGELDLGQIVLGVALTADGATALVVSSPAYIERHFHVFSLINGRMIHRQTITLDPGWWEWHLRSDRPGLLVGAGDGVTRWYGPGAPAAELPLPRSIATIRW